MPFGAERAVRVRDLLEEDADGRDIGRGRHDVVGHLAVGHAAVFPDHILVQRIADALRDAAFDLARREHRMDHRADFLHRDEIVDARFKRDGVDADFGHIDRPGESAVGIALIVVVVPEDARRRF